jgi:hypothetical protein
MIHPQLPDSTRLRNVPSPGARRSSRIRAGGLFASAVAVVGAVIVATAPPGATDPFPQCGDPDPAHCPAGSDLPGSAAPCSRTHCNEVQLPADLGSRMPVPQVTQTLQLPNDFGWTPGPDVPFTPIQCPPGFYISGDHCQMIG